MTTAEGPKKEQSILELSEGIGKELEDFQARLDGYFNRAEKESKPPVCRTQAPNVLDEIIETLETDLATLRRMSSFVVSEVLPKIK